MDRDEIIELLKAYHERLTAEHAAIQEMAVAQSHDDYEKMDTIANATIDGKNADARKRQEAEALALSERYQDALADVALAERTKALASINVRVTDAEIGLTKAWLYSQSGIDH